MIKQIPELNQQRVDQFSRFLDYYRRPDDGSMTGSDWKALYEQNRDMLLAITPHEVFAAFSGQLGDGQTPTEVLAYLNKIINVLHRGLSDYAWPKPEPGTFLAVMMAENDALLALLNELKPFIRMAGWQEKRPELLHILGQLAEFNSHYLKKENILFPFLEKADAHFHGLSIMWQLHDQARGQIRQLTEYLQSGGADDRKFVVLASDLIFTLHGLVFKETLILYPAAAELFTAEACQAMLAQSFDYGFALITPPARPSQVLTDDASDQLQIVSPTGRLDLAEALMIFNALPVDITYVDANNQVRYFNKAKDRLFPRSPAVIGRDVSRCHPAASVHVVESIIAAFRSGQQDQASFWLDVKGRMVLIQYFALRNENGVYRGVLEVSQDITGIRQLEGQRRLLQWDKP